MVVGVVLTVGCGCAAPFFFLVSLLAANPCGAFGDACDEQGTWTTGFIVVAAITVLAIVGWIVGVALWIIAVIRRNQHV